MHCSLDFSHADRLHFSYLKDRLCEQASAIDLKLIAFAEMEILGISEADVSVKAEMMRD